MAYTSSQVVQAVPTGIQSGLVLIAKTTLTAATQHNLLNVFSSAYDHYQIRFTDLIAGTNALNMRYGTSGTPDTGSNYSNNGIYADATQIVTATARFNGTSHILIGNVYTNGNGLFVNISSPFLSKQTFYENTGIGLTSYLATNMHQGLMNTATSYTDLVLLSTSNISGVISIYGYVNS